MQRDEVRRGDPADDDRQEERESWTPAPAFPPGTAPVDWVERNGKTSRRWGQETEDRTWNPG